ncbi:helical backbone metal receptor [Ekhidna sp.]|uniref:helical backbone metal receptor n=1 Tax=Ekhidna sp. TaxID=2608089 RepID=UPI003CCBA106
MISKTYTDQMGREVTIASPPRRIVSLVPSQTEFLIDIGALVVGRTKFCVHPTDQVKDLPVIGGTKNFHIDKIRQLKPDLIIGNKEENYREGIEELEKEFPVWMSDIYTLKDSFEMMSSIGQLCDLEAPAKAIIGDCKKATENVKRTKSGKVIYLIWKDPWMAAGKNTFIDHLLNHLGYENLITGDRYPELTTEQITDLNPEKILFSSEPFPFKEKHLEKARGQWPKADCQLVDGELYSWYGSRLRFWSK